MKVAVALELPRTCAGGTERGNEAGQIVSVTDFNRTRLRLRISYRGSAGPAERTGDATRATEHDKMRHGNAGIQSDQCLL